MNRIDRLFGILTMLQSKKYVSADKIAERFTISIRTVYRDVKALGEQGIPVSFEQNKGYFIVQGYFLPPVAFSSEEANALLLMESIVYNFSDKSIHEHYSNALSKIRAVLRGAEKDKVDSLDATLRHQFPACMKPDPGHLSKVQNAITSKDIIQIEYKSNSDEITLRKVECIGLVFYAFSWHLIGWCHIRQDYRDFKVSRIINMQNLGIPFCKAEHITLNEYMKLLPVDY